MSAQKTIRFNSLFSMVLIFGILFLSGCGQSGSHHLTSDFSALGSGGTPSPETQADTQGAELIEDTASSAPCANSIETIYGSWYINSSTSTLWFNELSYEYSVPSSDFTVKNFDLQTLQPAQNLDNRTYYFENDLIKFDTFSGEILSFSYQCYSDGTLVLTSTATDQAITLTREMGTGGNTVTELIGGHKYGHRMGNEGWGSNYPSFGSVLAWEGGIAYFVDMADNDHLYCCNEDGTNRQLMSDMITADVNIMDGWVYFTGYDESNRLKTTGVYKMKLDGTGLQKLFVSGSSNGLSVVDNKLYYTQLTSDGSSLYQCDLDGNNEKMIANLESYGDSLINFRIFGDNAYFAYADMSGAVVNYYCLMSVSLSDGAVNTLVQKMSSKEFIIDKDGIFAVRRQDVYHYDLNGGSEAKLVDCFTNYVIETGGYLIYYGGTNTRGTEMVSLMDLQHPTTILDFGGKVCYADKYLYYYDSGELKVTAYR